MLTLEQYPAQKGEIGKERVINEGPKSKNINSFFYQN